MNTHASQMTASLQRRRSWFSLIAWGVLLGVLAWSWQGAEMRPSLLVTNADNMATLAGDFFPPAFGNLGHYINQMLVTIQIAIWGKFGVMLRVLPRHWHGKNIICP